MCKEFQVTCMDLKLTFIHSLVCIWAGQCSDCGNHYCKLPSDWTVQSVSACHWPAVGARSDGMPVATPAVAGMHRPYCVASLPPLWRGNHKHRYTVAITLTWTTVAGLQLFDQCLIFSSLLWFRWLSWSLELGVCNTGLLFLSLIHSFHYMGPICIYVFTVTLDKNIC